MKVKEESEKSGLKLNIQKTKIMASGPITSWQIEGETMDTVRDVIFLGSKITADGHCSHEIKRCLLLGRKPMTNLDSILKNRDITLPTKVHLSQSYGFSSSHVWMWVLDHKESWVLKNWCFWTVVLEKTLESPLDCKEIQPVNPKGNQSWIFIGRTDAKAETSILWPHNAKNWLTGRDPDAGKDWRQEEKGMTEDEMVGCHHWLDGHEFEQTPKVGHGQGSLACCSPWGHKELDTTELNWTKYSIVFQLPHLFICQWTTRLLPRPSYHKQCCNEHWGTCVSFNFGFLGVHAHQLHCWVIWQFYFQYFKESSLCSPGSCTSLHSHQQSVTLFYCFYFF